MKCKPPHFAGRPLASMCPTTGGSTDTPHQQSDSLLSLNATAAPGGSEAELAQMVSEKCQSVLAAHQDSHREDTNSSLVKCRKDYNGVRIDKMLRSHHITFRDRVPGGKLVEVKEVESFKELNKVEIPMRPLNSCCCVVF